MAHQYSPRDQPISRAKCWAIAADGLGLSEAMFDALAGPRSVRSMECAASSKW